MPSTDSEPDGTVALGCAGGRGASKAKRTRFSASFVLASVSFVLFFSLALTPQSPQSPPGPAQSAPAPATGVQTPPVEAKPAAPALPAPRPRASIVLDAAHGGDETGAALNDKLNEKDVTLAFARRLRAELAARGLTATMVRDADTALTADQRAELANTARPQIYVALHASSAGKGLRLFTAVLPQTEPAPGSLAPWQRAQQAWLDASHAVVESLAADLADKQLPATVLEAPLRPLNSITAAALAVELAPPPGGRATVDMLSSQQYQQRVAAALAAALLVARDKLERAP